MSNAFEKTINLGLGFLLYSREKVEEVVEELVGRGEVAKKRRPTVCERAYAKRRRTERRTEEADSE